MASHEEILADFQSITGIDDVAEAIQHLENAHWDLIVAISSVTPNDSQILPSENGPSESANNAVAPEWSSMAGTSAGTSNDTRARVNSYVTINVRINYPGNEMHNRIVTFALLSDDIVGSIKAMLSAECDIPVNKQLLTDWPVVYPSSDDEQLLNLCLPSQSIQLTLNILHPDATNKGAAYTITLFDEVRCKEYTMTVYANQNVANIKMKVAELTGIKLRDQILIGWPDETVVFDTTKVHNLGLTRPVHSLYMRSSILPTAGSRNGETSMAHRENLASTSAARSDVSESESLPDFDDLDTHSDDDHMFVDPASYETNSQQRKPLLPLDFRNDTAASQHFIAAFKQRYGQKVPQFYEGSFDGAIKEALLKSYRERKPLVVYIHHDRSILSNVFCSQILCQDAISQCLNENSILYGWDFTSEKNKNILIQYINQSVGVTASYVIRDISVDQYPVMVILTRSRGTTEIAHLIYGSEPAEEVLSSLLHEVDGYKKQLQNTAVEEEEREMRDKIKNEQDEAYALSLIADRAKEEVRLKQERLEARKVAEEKEKAAKRQADMELVTRQLSCEPDDGPGVCRIRIRLPKNEFIDRRFLATDRLQDLLNFLISRGFHTDDYRLVSNFPRRDITAMEKEKSLKELDLYPQVQLILEER